MHYPLIRPLLFSLPPEAAHRVTLTTLQWLYRLKLSALLAPHHAGDAPCTIMGLSFPNRLGLAAGLDKNGEYIDALAALGFGFIEIGTVTPRPQSGNPRPRLFRVRDAHALINRMGFNNNGVNALIGHVRHAKYHGILGINIGKNFDTPLEQAIDDYIICLRKVYANASYVALNISSPNTHGLRKLQEAETLDYLLAALKTEQHTLAVHHGKYVPLAVKLAPDLDTREIIAIADILLKHEMDGVIATNTTLSRQGVDHLPHGTENGGLSGAPLRIRATTIIKQLSLALAGKIPIIGVGGVMNELDAQEKIRAGASLIQIYSGLIYHGPALVEEILASLRTEAAVT